jgi:hypothetical protein
VYQFSDTAASYSGALKMYYNNSQLNGLTASGLKLLIHNGSSWSLDNNSSSNTSSNVVVNNSVSGVSLGEITAATCSPNTGDTSASACGSFVWYGVTYTASATPTRTFTNVSGCDSVVTLHLTIIIQSVTPLTAPTERPDEPLTAGMDFGAGPGSEALSLPRERSLSEVLASMIDIDPTGEVQDLYNFVASRGL